MYSQASTYVADLLDLSSSAGPLRSNRLHLLSVPRTHFKSRGDRAFEVVAPKLWNDLPVLLHYANYVI